MAIDPVVLDLVASCLEYPDPGTAARARAAASGLASSEAELTSALFALAVFLERSEPGEAEERYTGLFDMNPVCTLHVGYHVFGDTYPRGEFLAALAAELRQAGIDTNGDLPDYLPTVLRLLARLERDEDRRALRELALLPSLSRMSASLAQSKDCWSSLVRALGAALPEAGDVPVEPRVAADACSSFVASAGGPAVPAGCSAAGPQPPPSW